MNMKKIQYNEYEHLPHFIVSQLKPIDFNIIFDHYSPFDIINSDIKER